MQSDRDFKVVENGLQFDKVNQNIVDGVQLTKEESQYLLPHFCMLLIGKPGSGKSTLLKQLLVNNQLYHGKFDEVILVSPSYAKMGLDVKDENVRSKFNLDWIFERIESINSKQMMKIFGNSKGGKKLEAHREAKGAGKPISKTSTYGSGRFQLGSILSKHSAYHNAAKSGFNTEAKSMQSKRAAGKKNEEEEKELLFLQKQQQMYKEISGLTETQQKSSHINVLMVFDDVVGQIKKAEFDPRLAQLVMNRRHLINNGTLSIIIVSQKYTLIPGRVRSNANWMILYQLNPMDFEQVYRDVVVQDINTWRQILSFVFGTQIARSVKESKEGKQKLPQEDSQFPDEEMEGYENEEQKEYGVGNSVGGFQEQRFSPGITEKQTPLPSNEPQKGVEEMIKDKKFENLGIWVEFNMYFKNFKRVQFN